MPTVGAEINRNVSEILKLCMKLQNVGVDAFFRWSPHVAWIEVDVYRNGWQSRDSGADIAFKAFRVSFNKVIFDKDLAQTPLEITLKELQAIKNYLTALLKKRKL